MPSVSRDYPDFAVHPIYVIPSDYTLRDRFGVAVDEAIFMQRVEDSILDIRRWYWDVLGAGKTFDSIPATFYRTSKTIAETFATYSDFGVACKAAYQEMVSRGLVHGGPIRRLPSLYLPLDMENGGNSLSAGDVGSPLFPWGAVVGGRGDGLLLGGLFRKFLSIPTTIANGTSSAGLVIQVAPGTGRNFAIAARFGLDQSRVQTISAPTSSTTLTVNDANWVGSTFPLDAVVWPYGQSPTVANAESIRITARAGNTLTVVRAQNGTTAIAISGGGGGAGSNIAKRQPYARVWTSPADPESLTSEVVQVTSINGDTLTISRGQEDAYFYGNARPARTLLTDDNIAVVDPRDVFFYINNRQASGAFAHELGHNFGMTHYTAAEVRNNQRVGPSPGYAYTFTDRRNETYRVSADSVTGVDFWEHLPHTQFNVTTPGQFGPWVMYSFWDYPFNNVASPAAGFTANEAARILRSPYLTTQPRP